MASARRITLSTAVKIARRIDLSISTAVKQWRRVPQSNRYAVKQWRGLCQWSSNKYRPIHHYKINKNRFSTNTNTNTCHDVPPEIGFTVDLADLLSTPERDFLIRSNNGQKVPISSLKGKLVGLYFCDNTSHPHRINAVKKVYEEAKSRGYDFEIVQITLHYHSFDAEPLDTDPTVSWLTVPLMDPSCRKIQRIFECIDDKNKRWYGDCLVLIHPCQPEDGDSSGVLFEFSGAEILKQWGIEGYPFTRQSLYKAEYEVQKREVTLQSLFPPGECLLRRPRSVGDGFDLVDAASQLLGKRVLVLFGCHDDEDRSFDGNFLSMLKSEYEAQVEECKFEVVYVSAGYKMSCFDEFTKDMPWLVQPFSASHWLFSGFLRNVFKAHRHIVPGPAAVAFNEQGELIAKEDPLCEKKEGDKLRFPFIDQDLEKCIRGDVERLCPSIRCNKYHDLSTAVKHRKGSENGDLSTALKQWRVKGLPFSKKDRYRVDEVGYTVDVADLLFTPERDFLIKNNGHKIKIDDLRGKTIVLFIVPLDEYDVVDMIDAYCELLRMGSNVEFVFVPVKLRIRSAVSVDGRIMSPEASFHQLFSTMPFPAIPFSDVHGPEGPVAQTFSVDDDCRYLPYWVVIDPTNTVVATRYWHHNLFELFGGAELHPLSRERISAVEDCYESNTREQRVGKWDELLASDTRDFLLSSNGDKVPISSLKGKLIGLYFCENIPHPPRMKAIKKVYEEAKSRGYDFEIVQITFHYLPLNAKYPDTDPTVQQCREDVSWLTLPFKDPSCRKINRIILGWSCTLEEEEEDARWVGDCLVLIKDQEEDKFDHYIGVISKLASAEILESWAVESLPNIRPCLYKAPHRSGFFFEYSGAEILERWGIEGYPFTPPSLGKAEYEVQKREVRLQSLFPPGECLLRRSPAGDGFDLVDAVSQLSGKRVLVLFAPHHNVNDCNFGSMLKSEYEAQVEDNVAEESKFEVVYVSIDDSKSSNFDELTSDMPWLVRPFSSDPNRDIFYKVFKSYAVGEAAAAFNEQGELIAKEDLTNQKKEGDHKLRFPFIDQNLEKFIWEEIEAIMRYHG